MKLLVLAAFIAVVSSGKLSEQQQDNQWPWQSGKLYRYEVNSHTLARLHEGASSGNAFKAQFIVRVKYPGRLLAKLENPVHAQFNQQLPNNMAVPSDLKYETVQNLDKPFEISVEGGRVVALSLPSAFLLSHENLLKGLLSTLQVDLSAYHHVHNHQDSYDKERQQGLFKKMETDVTGDCETLYTVSPVAAEWRRELPRFANQEDPMEITKSKNYGHCHHRVAYHFGVPEGAEWTGTAHRSEEKQFIAQSTVSRILAGKQGPIYKAETTSTVSVHPHLYGKQKAQVHSYVQLILVSVEQDSGVEWQKPEGTRQIKTLLYAMTTKQMAIHDQSSSQESSESHEHIHVEVEQPKSRARRSSDRQQQEFNKDWRSSSSSDSSSAYINDDLPRINEPAYAALYMSAQSRGDKKQNTMNAQKLLQDIAQQLQNPNNMPKADFLSKFNILVRIIASMSSDQLAQTSRGIEVGRTSNNNVKVDMWMIFRDAVVQAGTPPAFLQIKTWILNKKLQNEEAAQVISTLARTLRYPTKEIMIQFFELAMNPVVQEQERLNTSALIAATKFIYMGQVNNETAHYYYPSHMYGRLARRNDRFVLDDILPRLSEKLQQAIEKQEWSRAQVYIKAIGNLGHREILQVFSPYLEGRIQVPTYLRVQMVVQLRSLAHQKDKYVRAVLYSILRNTAEPYEVRVAAILNIFMAHPTAEMMQVMAQMTNEDPSVQVRSALKSGIVSAADLKDPHFWHLSRTAQAVRPIVTKENLGTRYSNKFFEDNYVNEDEQGSFRAVSYIGGDSKAMPKYQTYSWRDQISGWGFDTIGASFSDAQEIVDFLKQMMYEPLVSNANHKYTAQKISEMLKIKRNPESPLEGAFFFNIANQERFFSFDESDLIRLVQDVMEYMKELEQGVDKHYTKVFNAHQVSVMFPVASGMPFIYKYKEPIVIHIQSKAKGKMDRDPQTRKYLTSTMDKELQITIARNIDGNVGFMDTLSNQLASAGVVRKYQVNVPVKMSIQMNAGVMKMKVEPLRPDQDYMIAHFSVWPYTAIQKKDTLVPYSQDPTTKIVERLRKVASTDMKFGQQIGTIFQLQGYSYSADYRNAGNLLQTLYKMDDLLAVRDIALTHYNLRYLGKQSQNKVLTLTAAYDQLFNQKQSGELGQADKRKDVTPNSEARREEMLKRVSAGINNARAQVVDFSATFEGPQKQEYVLTAAIAKSPVDLKIQSAVFAGRNSVQQGNEQINAVVKVTKPEISALNFLEALKKDVKMTYEADIKYGQDGNIHIQGNTERTKKYTELLQKHPLAKLVQEQIANGNQYQLASHKMLIKAYAPDSLKASVTYKNVSPMFMNWTSQAYNILKQLSWNADVNPMKRVADGKLQFDVQTSYVDQTLRFEMTSPSGVLRFDNVLIPKFTPYMVSLYYPFSMTERFANYYSSYQYQPFCSIDGNQVRTFSNRSYNYELSKSWHVVMREEYNKIRGKWDDLVILARRPSQQQQEIYISYKTETGKDLEIEIQPAQSAQAKVQVKSNSKKISEGDLTIYWDDVAEAPLLQYFTTPDGVLMLNIRDGRLRAMYDGQRLVLTTQDYRTTTRGICGQNSGELREDYETPNGLVDLPEHYGASYSLDVEDSDPKTQGLKKEAQQKAYQSTPKYTAILRSDEQWLQAIRQRDEEWSTPNVYRTRSYLKKRGQCQLVQQVQYHENHGEICITTTPLPSCQSHCHGEGYKVQAAQVICQSKADQQFRTYRNQIQQGQNPQVTGVPKVEQYRVPTSCKA
ncbi:hypothetical protein B5X24_HaOG208265 [Helicoverpa armigera]|uniref:Vitellogenin n=1 Tax=Helicoverpa armigera TaxID=29058 RepID=A0A2W1BQW6_HELAM|nr:hypothetical protein B5X24_HaOG208265 [Helicoverpa armigera]